MDRDGSISGERKRERRDLVEEIGDNGLENTADHEVGLGRSIDEDVEGKRKIKKQRDC